jgi:uncharacterized membrane protein YqjE
MNDSSARDSLAPMAVVASMARTRLELASLDLQTHVGATLTAVALATAAFVLSLVAFAFIGVAVIAVFWDTHRVLATVATTLGYLSVALTLALHARARWRSRPSAFAGLLRELELDAEALRRHR